MNATSIVAIGVLTIDERDIDCGNRYSQSMNVTSIVAIGVLTIDELDIDNGNIRRDASAHVETFGTDVLDDDSPVLDYIAGWR